MSNFESNDYLSRVPIGIVPTGSDGVFTLDAARPDVSGSAVQ